MGEDEEVMEEGSVVSTVGAGGFRVSDFLKNLCCLDVWTAQQLLPERWDTWHTCKSGRVQRTQ